MKDFLLDTHVLLWWAEGSKKLSAEHRAIIEDLDSRLWLSVVSVWEATIKSGNGKLDLPGPAKEFFADVASRFGFGVLPIHLSHAAGVGSLPPIHSDPFDRLLLSQAIAEGYVLLSDDASLYRYQVEGLEIR
ncbi:MAG: type II toxin-antitoxin system VapC family toxin [Candidatus Eremiobacteraeota bacterium]|nr:type II toxin-antitoxin system VapC family toxin [Candidatus Eremiobacteraeota bacterium]MCW5871668.1 type II toxin-antitoxin system VapC family toxin [Candidatus Eremiobacteraeota bacterium]